MPAGCRPRAAVHRLAALLPVGAILTSGDDGAALFVESRLIESPFHPLARRIRLGGPCVLSDQRGDDVIDTSNLAHVFRGKRGNGGCNLPSPIDQTFVGHDFNHQPPIARSLCIDEITGERRPSGAVDPDQLGKPNTHPSTWHHGDRRMRVGKASTIRGDEEVAGHRQLEAARHEAPFIAPMTCRVQAQLVDSFRERCEMGATGHVCSCAEYAIQARRVAQR